MKDTVIINEFEKQYKGNVHMHSTRSDGKYDPGTVIGRYRSAGYDFIQLSDHEIYFNTDIYDKEDFVALGGTEISIRMNEDRYWLLDYHQRRLNNNRTRHHYMHYGCIQDENQTPPEGFFEHDYVVPYTVDQGIDSWNRAIDNMKSHGCLVVVNHPSWSRVNPEYLLCQNTNLMEIWNSGNIYKCGGESDEYYWDYCLSRGKRYYGIAADDAHECTTDFGKGFIMVSADHLDRKSIVRGIRDGNFYASTGPVIKSAVIMDGVLKMEFSPVVHVKIMGADYDGANVCSEDMREFTSFVWKINEEQRYFRVTLIDRNGNRAWMQPVFIEDLEV